MDVVIAGPRAMQHPCFKIWGHALGRLMLAWPPIECRVEGVLDAAAATSRVAIEINGDPYRLDLEPCLIRAALARGLRFVVSTHAQFRRGPRESQVRGSDGPARLGARDDVLNTLEASAFARAVSPAGRACGVRRSLLYREARAWLFPNGDRLR